MPRAGSVTVEVIPDARGFSSKLQAQIGDEKVHVGVDLDTGEAEARLAALRAETDRVGKSADSSAGGMSKLISAAIALGPAIVPIGAAAVAAALGFAGLGAAGLLAFKGINTEIQKGTGLGAEYQHAFQPVLDEFGHLQRIAAAGVFTGLNAGIQQSKQLFPELNTDVAKLSSSLGVIVGNTGAGLVALFHQLNPLFLDVSTGLEHGSASFEHWAQSSDGVRKFVAYAQAQLPEVVQTGEDLAVAIGHIAVAAAPLGGVTLKAISDLAAAIASIPTPVLTGLLLALQVNRLLSIAGGIKGIGSALDDLKGKALGAGAGLRGFVTSGAGILATTGYIGGLAIATGLLANTVQDKLPQVGVNINKLASDASKASKDYGDAVDQFGQQIEQAFEQGGAGADNLAKKAAVAATNLGPVETALHDSGLSASYFADALTGTDQDWQRFIANTVAGMEAAGDSRFLIKDTVSQLNDLRDAFNTGKISGEEFRRQYQAINDELAKPNAITTADSMQVLADETGIATQTLANYAQMFGITQDAVANGRLTFGQLSDAVGQVSRSYDLANVSTRTYLDALQGFSTSAGTALDRAKLIGATLVAAQGDALGFAAAMNAGAVASAALTTDLKGAADQAGVSVGGLLTRIVDLKTGTINYTNSAAQPLIADLQSMQTAAMNAAEAQYQHEVSLKGGAAAADLAYGTFEKLTKGALVDQYRQLGITKDQATKLADQYFGMPKDVKTKIEQEGADPVLTVLGEIKDFLHELVDPTWKPTVGLIDHATVPLSAIDQHLGLTGRTKVYPDVGLVDGASVPLSAVDASLSAVGRRHPTPTVSVVDQATATIVAIESALYGIPRQIFTTITTQHNDIFTVQDAAGNRGPAGVTSATGNIFDSVKSYDNGGMNKHMPQIATTLRVFGEPETRGEAYIPLANDLRRVRAVDLTRDVADRFGYDLTPRTDEKRVINNYWTIPQQVDEEALTMAVTRRQQMASV